MEIATKTLKCITFLGSLFHAYFLLLWLQCLSRCLVVTHTRIIAPSITATVSIGNGHSISPPPFL